MNAWFGRAQSGTRQAFLRRLLRLRRHIGPLIGCGLEPVSAENAKLHVVDISTLHDGRAALRRRSPARPRLAGEAGHGPDAAPLRGAGRAEQVRPGPRLLAAPGPAGRHRRARAARSACCSSVRSRPPPRWRRRCRATRRSRWQEAPRRQRIRRLPLPDAGPARARHPLHAGDDGRRATHRPGADPPSASRSRPSRPTRTRRRRTRRRPRRARPASSATSGALAGPKVEL